jgi:hypothetical protein
VWSGSDRAKAAVYGCSPGMRPEVLAAASAGYSVQPIQDDVDGVDVVVRHGGITVDVQRWLNSSDSKTGDSPVASMVTFIEKPNTVQVQGPPAVNVGVNKTEAGRKYIQTFADKTWTNNLLSLPRYQ